MDIGITILIWTMWGLLAVLGLLLFLAHLPYRAHIAAEWDETHMDARGWLGWPLRLLGVMVSASFEQQQVAFYFLGLQLKSWSFGELKEKREKKREKKPKVKKKKKPGDSARRRHQMHMPHKGHALKQLSRWLFLSASLQGRFGFDDPYDTGQLAMGLTLIRTAFPSIGRKVALDYVEPVCEGRLDLSMMVWLPRIEVGIIIFLLSRQGRAMVRHYRARPKPAQSAA
jgi:hypothetical protein